METSGTFDSTTPFEYDLGSLLCENHDIKYTNYVTAFLYSLVSILSLVGNSLVLLVLIKFENLESLTNLFILNLCLSDLVFSCLLPIWILDLHSSWMLGEFMCKLFNMAFSISLYSSIFFLTIMTIHRYLSVVSPISSLRVHTLRCRVLMTTAIWVASLLSSIGDTIFHKVVSNDCKYSEQWAHLASVYQHNIFFLLSMAIILFCYIQILRTLFRSPSKRRHRTVRLIFTIVTAYFLSWAPYNLIMFLKTLLKIGVIKSCQVSQQLDLAELISRYVAFSHCCINPVLYVFVGIKFRRHLNTLLRQFSLSQQQISSPSPLPQSPGAFIYEGASFY
ncbi:chemokine XC receptor 1 [Ochotona curzoniae]|uniref:chemokine XC receptor 1 n=1 Tax=Ochotona curzoniae TaxID=130825 RepID=UPI001B35074E|nr:chemokine XC receptor 1 [Ochotona curzoniae]